MVSDITRVGPAVGTTETGSEVLLFLVQAEVGGELLHVAGSSQAHAKTEFHQFIWRSLEVYLRAKIREREKQLDDHA